MYLKFASQVWTYISDAVFNLHIWQQADTLAFFWQNYLHHTSHLILDHAGLNPSENYSSSHIAYVLPYFFGCEQLRFASSVTKQKHILQMVVGFNGWIYHGRIRKQQSLKPRSWWDLSLQPTHPQVTNDTIKQRHNSAIPKAWERQNCCCLASLKHLETWMAGQQRRPWWLSEVKNMVHLKTVIIISNFRNLTTLPFWCWSLMLNFGRVNLCQFYVCPYEKWKSLVIHIIPPD